MDLDILMDATELALHHAYRPRRWRRPEALLFLTSLRHETACLLEDAWADAQEAWAEVNALAAERDQLRAELADAEQALDMYRREPAAGPWQAPAVTRESELARLREGIIQPGPLGQATAAEPATAPEPPLEAPRTAAEPQTGATVGIGTPGRQEGSQSREAAS